MRFENAIRQWEYGQRDRETAEAIVSGYDPMSDAHVTLIGRIAGMDGADADTLGATWEHWYEDSVGEDGIAIASDGSIIAWAAQIPVRGEGRIARKITLVAAKTLDRS